MCALAIAIAGCAADDAPPPPVSAPPQAKMVTNLNDVAATPVNPLAIDQVPKRGEGLILDSGPSSAAPRTFQATPGMSRQIGTDANPATVRLLNAKAAKFGNFSAAILDHIYAHLIVAERSEEISRGKLPEDLKAVIITATMNKDGKLIELVLEQHSGKAKIDQMMLEVCKKSIWYANPPTAALSEDGTYKLTIKLKLENYASLDENHWSFVTDLGLGVG
jgi:hypothetical protein